MEKVWYEDIKIIKNDAPYDKYSNIVEFVVNNSYDENGTYHEYLKDFAEAAMILVMYTNCDTNVFSFEQIMQLITSDRWHEIIEELGSKYVIFHRHVDKEIEYRNAPMRKMDDFLTTSKEAIFNINNLINAIDVDALKEYDFSKIINAVNNLENKRSEQ